MAAPMQQAFNAGELSRRLRAMWGSPVYARGLDYCENFEPLPQGPLLLRAGTEFLSFVNADLGTNPRVIPFRVAGKQDAYIVLGPQKLRIFRADGTEGGVSSGGGIPTLGTERVPTPGVPPWVNTTNNVDFSVGPPAYLTINETEECRVPITIEEAGDHRFVLDGKSYSGDTINRVLSILIGSTDGGSEVLNYGNFTGIRGDWATVSWLPDVNFPAPGTYYLTLKRPAAVYTTPISVRNISLRKIGSTLAIPAPWTQAQIHDVQYVSETGKDRMILVHTNQEPRVLTCVDGDVNWTLQTLTEAMTAAGTQNTKPAEWTGANWPGVVEIHKGRTWWSGTPNERNKVWASKAGAPFDFGVSNPTVDADAIIETLATKGAINWFKGKKVLLCGTDDEETAFTAQGGVLTPKDINADDESAFGSARKMAVHAGNKALYVSQDRRKVRAIGYDAAQSNGWASKDITFIAEHITAGGIDEIQFGKEPHNTIILRVGAELRFCTFDEGEQVVAWWRGTTRGTILSIAASNGPEGTMVVLLVEREAGILMERLWIHERTDRQYLDASVIKTLAAGVVNGLAHLNGENARVIVNGSLKGDYPVAGGKIAIADEDEGAEVVVGLPYLGKAVTLPKNVKGGKTRSPKLGVMLEDSALPKINGKRPPERDPGLAWDAATGRCSGKFEVAGNLGWDGEGKVTIEQDLPFRTEILALFENTQANDL